MAARVENRKQPRSSWWPTERWISSLSLYPYWPVLCQVNQQRTLILMARLIQRNLPQKPPCETRSPWYFNEPFLKLLFSVRFSHHIARQPCRDLHLRYPVLDDLYWVRPHDTLGRSPFYSNLLQTSTDICVWGLSSLPEILSVKIFFEREVVLGYEMFSWCRTGDETKLPSFKFTQLL